MGYNILRMLLTCICDQATEVAPTKTLLQNTNERIDYQHSRGEFIRLLRLLIMGYNIIQMLLTCICVQATEVAPTKTLLQNTHERIDYQHSRGEFIRLLRLLIMGYNIIQMLLTCFVIRRLKSPLQ